MLREQKSTLKSLISIDPQTAAGNINGNEIDVKDFDSAKFVCSGDGTAVGTIKIQETDTSGSGYADAAAADVFGTQGEDVDATNTIRTLAYIGSKRYVRLVWTNTTGGVIAGTVELGCAHLSPVSGN
jgi:hypothetical protein